MISRVAECCFWLFRQLERAESMARLLGVNRSFVLDLGLPDVEHWRPLVVVSGEQRRFQQFHAPDQLDDGEVVQEYMVWSEENPVSVVSAVRWARENARMVREVVSQEMWEALNGLWHWLTRGPGRRAFARNRDEFYHQVVEGCVLFQGLSHNTMLHEEPFDFMRLGMLLERAGQTARILDVKHHALGPTRSGLEGPEEVAQWAALLQSCGATELFLQRFGGALDGPSVVVFLLLDAAFPRSVTHCVDRSWNFLRRIRPQGNSSIGRDSAERLVALRDRLRRRSIADILETGLHRELTEIIAETARVCDAVSADYFAPEALHAAG